MFTVAPATADPAPEVVNIAHRGASSTAPENTLPAISQVAARADFVEMDIRLTEDGVPVIPHDQSLRRTTDVEEVFPGRSPWAVDDFTLTEVRRLDAGSWRSADYRGAAVPTLDDALGELAGSPAGVVLEVKDPEMYGGVTGIGSKIMSVVMSHPRWAGAVRREQRQLVVQSFEWPFLRDLSAAHQDLRVSLLGTVTPQDMDANRFASEINVHSSTVTDALVAAARERSLPLVTYTLDTPLSMSELIARGVDGVVTNRPAVLRDVLSAQGRLWTRTPWPAPASAAPSWSLNVQQRARKGSRVPVSANLTTREGRPDSWRWAVLQLRRAGRWATVQRRATDASGGPRTTVKVTRDLRLRLVTDDKQSPVAVSASRSIDARAG